MSKKLPKYPDGGNTPSPLDLARESTNVPVIPQDFYFGNPIARDSNFINAARYYTPRLTEEEARLTRQAQANANQAYSAGGNSVNTANLTDWSNAGQNQNLDVRVTPSGLESKYALPELNVQAKLTPPDRPTSNNWKNWDKLSREEQLALIYSKGTKYGLARLEEKANYNPGEWKQTAAQAAMGVFTKPLSDLGTLISIPAALVTEHIAGDNTYGRAFDFSGRQRSLSDVAPTGNPYGDMALDILGDPTTYIGGAGAAKHLGKSAPKLASEVLKDATYQVGKDMLSVPLKNIKTAIPKYTDDALKVFNKVGTPPPFKGSQIDDITETMAQKVAEKKAWLTSDEYIKRRMATTGEPKSRILADVDRHLETIEKNADPTVYEFPDDTYGFASQQLKMNGDSPIRNVHGELTLQPNISLNAKYKNTPDFVATYEHELDHITSPMFYPSRGGIEKAYPRLPLKPTWEETPIGKVFPGLGGKASKTRGYLSEPIEQQARFNELNSLIRDDLKLGKIYSDAPELKVQDIDKYFGDNPVEVLRKLDELGYSDVSSLLEENMKYIRGKSKKPFASNPENVTKFKEGLLDVLNRAWAVPGAIGAGYLLNENQEMEVKAYGGPVGDDKKKKKSKDVAENNMFSVEGMPINPYAGKSYHAYPTINYDKEVTGEPLEPIYQRTFGDKMYDIFHSTPRVRTTFANGGPIGDFIDSTRDWDIGNKLYTYTVDDKLISKVNGDKQGWKDVSYLNFFGSGIEKDTVWGEDDYKKTTKHKFNPSTGREKTVIKETGKPKTVIKGSPGVYAYGGMTTPQYEAEGGEVVDGGMPVAFNGGNITPNSTTAGKINGNTHEQGGVDMAGGKRVFSDRLYVDSNFLKDLDI